jgi:hypothetical protein
MPDITEVELPPGKLGVALKGSPPMPVSYKENSAVGGLFPTGMFIDTITLADGTELSGLSTQDLVSILSDTSNERGRVLTFKNPKTMEPTPPGINLPKEKTITLPTGKIRVYFKGRDRATVSQVLEDSPLRNSLSVGMVVDVLNIPGQKRYTALNAKEISQILLDTAHIKNRTMVIKYPPSTPDESVAQSDGDSMLATCSQSTNKSFPLV